MIPLEAALAIVDEKIGDRRVSTESVPVRSASGRILTADQYSRVDLPPFDKSAVDGYAVPEGALDGASTVRAPVFRHREHSTLPL